MSGLGNLFNYEKPGKGIDKNAPKKTGIALFFDIFKEKFWSLIPLSLLYVLLSLPILTVGLANVGITYITRNFTREKPVFLVSEFFSTIKKNWKQGLAVGIINLVVTAMLAFVLYFYYQNWNVSLAYKAGFVITGCIAIVFTFMRYYINILIVTFDLKLSQLYKNSLLLSSGGVKENIVITVSLIGLYAFFFGIPLLWLYIFEQALPTLIFGIAAILFLPAIQSLIIQFCVFPVVKKLMIDPYYEAHPEAKKDMAILNLYDEEEQGNEDDVVFKDVGTTEVQTEETTTIPKQYSKRDIKQMRRRQNNDDDDTI